MIDDALRQQVIDEEHLRLLVLFYFISAATTAFFAFIPVIYVVMGFVFVGASSNFASRGNDVPPAFLGWIFVGIGFVILALLLGFAALKFYAARSIRARRNRTLCLVTAGLSCLFVPYGTVLGVLSLMVLERASVKQLFGQAAVPAASPQGPSVGTAGAA